MRLRYAGDHDIDIVNLSLFADPYLYYCGNDAGQRALMRELPRAHRPTVADERTIACAIAPGVWNGGQDLRAWCRAGCAACRP